MTDERRRILIVKLADLGDVLLCEPAIRSLRAGFPNARIDLLVSPAARQLAGSLGHDASVRTFPKGLFDDPHALVRPRRLATATRFTVALRRARYDTVVLLHHLTTPAGALKFRALAAATGSRIVAGLDNGRGHFLTHRAPDLGFGRLHDAEYMLRVAQCVGGADVDPAPRLPRPVGRSEITIPEPYVTLFPATGAYSRAREWPAERFAAVASALEARGILPVVVGGDDATRAAQVIAASAPTTIDLSGRTTLPQLFPVLAGARAAVGGDTFIGHAAAALGTPVVSIFGPSNRDAWRPYGSVNFDRANATLTTGLVVYHDLPCEPCIYTGFSLGRPQGCPTRTCLHRVDEARVLAAIDRVMEVA